MDMESQLKGEQTRGKLILFPVSIGNENLATSLPAYNSELLNTCNTFIVEELRTARRFLKKAGYVHSIDDTEFYLLNEHTQEVDIANYLDAIDKGEAALIGCQEADDKYISDVTAEDGLELMSKAHKEITALEQKDGK